MPKPWTLLLYMAADGQEKVPEDTDIADAAFEDLDELRRMGSNPKVDIGVHLDMGLFPPVRFGIGPGGDQILRAELHESDTGDPKTLRAFLDWAQNALPAQRYFLVLWGHGLGIGHVLVKHTSQADTAQDGNDGLNATELADVLERFKRQRGGQPLDIIGFHSCFMSGIEIAYQLRGLVGRMVGTQDLEPFPGLPYDRILQQLKSHPAARTSTVADLITEEVIRSFTPTDRVTQTALNPEAAAAVADAMKGLVEELGAEQKDTVGKILRRAKHLGAREFVDLLDLCRLLREHGSRPETRNAAGNVSRLLEQNGHGFITRHRRRGAETKRLNGVSIYFRKVRPLKSEVKLSLEQYRELEFVKETGWQDFVDRLPKPSQAKTE